MRNVSMVNWFALVCNLCIGLVLILSVATVIQERSKDIVRLTVNEDKLLDTVGKSQILTGKYAYAYPANPEETKWVVVVDDKSEPI